MLTKLPVSSSKPPSHLNAADIARCRKYHSLPPIVGWLPAGDDIPLPIRFLSGNTYYIIDVAEETMP
jgi:hypothetical protein